MSSCGGEGILAPDATCIAAVNVHGVHYVLSPLVAVTPADISSEPDVEITRNTGCLDQGEPAEDLAHGSRTSFRPARRFTESRGTSPSTRWPFGADLIAEWQVVSPMPY